MVCTGSSCRFHGASTLAETVRREYLVGSSLVGSLRCASTKHTTRYRFDRMSVTCASRTVGFDSELPITTQAPYLLFDWRLAIPEGPQDIHQRKRGRSWRHAVESVFASDHHRPLMQNVAVELAERLDAHACGRKRRDDFSRRMIPLDGWCLRSRCYGVSIGHAAQPKAFRRREISVEDFGFVGLAKDPLKRVELLQIKLAARLEEIENHLCPARHVR